MDKNQHPKLLFGEIRKAVDPLFADGYLIQDFRITMPAGKIGYEVALVLYKADPENPDDITKGNSKGMALYIEDKTHAQAVFNMLKDYAQSKSTNARK